MYFLQELQERREREREREKESKTGEQIENVAMLQKNISY